MDFSGPSLDPPVLTSQAHKNLFRTTSSCVAEPRFQTRGSRERRPYALRIFGTRAAAWATENSDA